MNIDQIIKLIEKDIHFEPHPLADIERQAQLFGIDPNAIATPAFMRKAIKDKTVSKIDRQHMLNLMHNSKDLARLHHLQATNEMPPDEKLEALDNIIANLLETDQHPGLKPPPGQIRPIHPAMSSTQFSSENGQFSGTADQFIKSHNKPEHAGKTFNLYNGKEHVGIYTVPGERKIIKPNTGATISKSAQASNAGIKTTAKVDSEKTGLVGKFLKLVKKNRNTTNILEACLDDFLISILEDTMTGQIASYATPLGGLVRSVQDGVDTFNGNFINNEQEVKKRKHKRKRLGQIASAMALAVGSI